MNLQDVEEFLLTTIDHTLGNESFMVQPYDLTSIDKFIGIVARNNMTKVLDKLLNIDDNLFVWTYCDGIVFHLLMMSANNTIFVESISQKVREKNMDYQNRFILGEYGFYGLRSFLRRNNDVEYALKQMIKYNSCYNKEVIKHYLNYLKSSSKKSWLQEDTGDIIFALFLSESAYDKKLDDIIKYVDSLPEEVFEYLQRFYIFQKYNLLPDYVSEPIKAFEMLVMLPQEKIRFIIDNDIKLLELVYYNFFEEKIIVDLINSANGEELKKLNQPKALQFMRNFNIKADGFSQYIAVLDQIGENGLRIINHSNTSNFYKYVRQFQVDCAQISTPDMIKMLNGIKYDKMRIIIEDHRLLYRNAQYIHLLTSHNVNKLFSVDELIDRINAMPHYELKSFFHFLPLIYEKKLLLEQFDRLDEQQLMNLNNPLMQRLFSDKIITINELDLSEEQIKQLSIVLLRKIFQSNEYIATKLIDPEIEIDNRIRNLVDTIDHEYIKSLFCDAKGFLYFNFNEFSAIGEKEKPIFLTRSTLLKNMLVMGKISSIDELGFTEISALEDSCWNIMFSDQTVQNELFTKYLTSPPTCEEIQDLFSDGKFIPCKSYQGDGESIYESPEMRVILKNEREIENKIPAQYAKYFEGKNEVHSKILLNFIREFFENNTENIQNSSEINQLDEAILLLTKIIDAIPQNSLEEMNKNNIKFSLFSKQDIGSDKIPTISISATDITHKEKLAINKALKKDASSKKKSSHDSLISRMPYYKGKDHHISINNMTDIETIADLLTQLNGNNKTYFTIYFEDRPQERDRSR